MIKIDYKNKKVLEPNPEKEVAYMVEETDLNLQQDVIATKRKLKEQMIVLNEIKSSYPLDVQRYLEVKSNVDALKDGLIEVANLQEELGFTVTANLE